MQGGTEHRLLGPRGMLLVADDEPILLKLMSRVLRRAGHRVVTAADGEQALQLYEASAEPVHAVVVDLLLRPRGATVLLRELLARDAGLGVVVTSGLLPDSEVQRLLANCGGDFVLKPFRPDALIRAVGAALEARTAAP